ncbi:hypothetical protein QEH68_20830 [Paenarthrobacter sp. OM7]|uniref:Uncharacterized protein n=1 Tax=Paenarthrobacter sp. AMU7 TaxID=3162492 RepID=A0AB39YP57_9MICC|nr:hypothetical protein [Paenarthrobacter sp. OM7]WGM20428.1 hypothetical protein QEH68_20830 [Paenarthrobacter sp. OM7]
MSLETAAGGDIGLEDRPPDIRHGGPRRDLRRARLERDIRLRGRRAVPKTPVHEMAHRPEADVSGLFITAASTG